MNGFCAAENTLWLVNKVWPDVMAAKNHKSHLEQKPHSLVLIGCSSQQALRIQSDEAEVGVEGGPHPHGAGAGRLGGVEDSPAIKQDVVEGVGLPISSVAKDGKDLNASDVATAESVHEV